MSELRIYKASAGSGKTFTLTLEYFKIIFSVPTEYRNILAVTFTNKATEEMKSRIIKELHKLAEGHPSNYSEELKRYFGIPEETLRNKASVLRTMLLHDYGRIAVTTIDRFFQRILKSFTKELGIFPGYNVELDSEFILLKAVDKVMEQVKEDGELRKWIGELMETSVEEGKSWSVKSRIAELGEELFKENYMLFDKKVLDKFGDINFLKDYQVFLRKIIRNYENELEETGKKAVGLILEAGLELSDFKNGKSGCAAHFYKLKEGRLDDVTKTARDGIGNLDSWVTKYCDASVRAKIETVFPQLSGWLEESVRLYDEQGCYYSSARQLSDNLYQLGILNDLYRNVREYCEEKGLMLLSDTTHILNVLIEGNDTSFLYEKVGNYYKHVMIDEFQDTSAMQWKNFRPLIVNSLSEGNRTMIVGDVKQSIYRWRNGDWSLLADQVEQEFRHMNAKRVVLGDNWRSGREIVDFNNLFFASAAKLLKTLYNDSVEGENGWSSEIDKAYAEAEQNVRSEKNGYVEICFGPQKKEEDSDRAIMQQVIAAISEILTRGGKLKDIVILVRNGKEGAFVADYLMEHNKTAEQSINFISNDSLYVWSSSYVRFIVAVLQYMIEPYDMVNRATILFFYYTYIKTGAGLVPDIYFKTAVESEELFGRLQSDFGINSGKIMSYSLFETVEAIIDKFFLRERKEEVPYLIAFQDIIFEYEANNSNSILLFMDWWKKEQDKKVLSTSEEIDAVRILTIHKSKGLEFNYVMLPFCNWELDSVRPVRRIWCHNDVPGFNRLDYAPLNYSAKLTGTIFRDAYFEEHLKAYVDNLNLLYVASTRAREELYIYPYTPRMNKDGSVSVSDMGSFVYCVLREWKEKGVAFTMDDTMNMRYGVQGFVKETSGKPGSVTLDSYPVFDLSDRISVKYKYENFTDVEEQHWSAVDEGKLLHEIFRTIEYMDDIKPAVQKASLEGLIRKEEEDEYCAKIAGCIETSKTGAWFSPTYQIINERDILSGHGRKSRPDRVLLKGEKAFVIDYKFGMKEENKYTRQVESYCAIMRQMGYKEVTGYIWYVTLNKILEVK